MAGSSLPLRIWTRTTTKASREDADVPETTRADLVMILVGAITAAASLTTAAAERRVQAPVARMVRHVDERYQLVVRIVVPA